MAVNLKQQKKDFKLPVKSPRAIKRLCCFYYCALKPFLPNDLIVNVLRSIFKLLQKSSPKSLAEFNLQIIEPKPLCGFSTYLAALRTDPKRNFILKTRQVDSRELRHPSFSQLFDQPIHALLGEQIQQCPFVDTLYCSFPDREAEQMVHVFRNVTLRPLLLEGQQYSEHQARFYFAELICALEFFHSRGKPGLFEKSREMVMLGDDGHVFLSYLKAWIPESQVAIDNRAPVLCQPDLPPYRVEDIAPENLNGFCFPEKQDFWCLGLTLFFMLTGRHPFGCTQSKDRAMNVVDRILCCKDPMEEEWPKELLLHEEGRSLLTELLQVEPQKRLSNFKDLKDHAWFSTVDWIRLSKKKIKPP